MNSDHCLNQAFPNQTGMHGSSAGNHTDSLTIPQDFIRDSFLTKVRLPVSDSREYRFLNDLGLLHDFLFHIEGISALSATTHIPVNLKPVNLCLISR